MFAWGGGSCLEESFQAATKLAKTGWSGLALPDHQHGPTRATKQTEHLSISLLVAIELCHPIVPPGRRDTAPRAAVQVPEAAADVDDLAVPRQDQIGGAGQIARVKTVSVSKAVDEPSHGHFRRRVAGLDGRHDSRAFGRGKGVSHREPDSSLLIWERQRLLLDFGRTRSMWISQSV